MGNGDGGGGRLRDARVDDVVWEVWEVWEMAVEACEVVLHRLAFRPSASVLVPCLAPLAWSVAPTLDGIPALAAARMACFFRFTRNFWRCFFNFVDAKRLTHLGCKVVSILFVAVSTNILCLLHK